MDLDATIAAYTVTQENETMNDDQTDEMQNPERKNDILQNVENIFDRGENGEQICTLCKAKNIRKQYSANTSPKLLNKHLQDKHGYTSLFDKTVTRKSLLKHFYRPKGDNVLDNVYCRKCLENKKLHGYSLGTNKSLLSRHLLLEHSIEFIPPMIKKRNTRRVPSEPISVSQETADMARELSETKGLPIRNYFINILEEPVNLMFCIFCILNGLRLQYSVVTNPAFLLAHLTMQHNFYPKKVGKQSLDDDDYADMISSLIEKRELIKKEDELLIEDEEPSLPYQQESVGQEILDASIISQEPNVHYCRSCGSDNISSIFSSFFYPNNDETDVAFTNFTLGDLYTEITGVQVHPDDGMPQGLCYDCEESLKDAYFFKAQANKMEETNIQNVSINQTNELHHGFLFQSLDSVRKQK